MITKMSKKGIVKLFSVTLCALLMLTIGLSISTPQAFAGTSSLKVTVKYAGLESREKVTFSSSELLGIGSQTILYTNLTDVGTVRRILGKGPSAAAVIKAAGIDTGSVSRVRLVGNDASREFSLGELSSSAYSYPNLPGNYDRDSYTKTITPLPGSLSGGKTVTPILAVYSADVIDPNQPLSESDLNTTDAIRYCLGQKGLREGVQTSKSDVTSYASLKNLEEMEITLSGSPVKGINLSVTSNKIKKGESGKATATISGDSLFKDAWGFSEKDLVWSTSNEKIGTVKNGKINVLGDGEFTITVKSPDGKYEASVVINGKDPEIKGTGTGTGQGSGKEKSKTNEPKMIKVREVSVGDKIVPEDIDTGEAGGAANQQSLVEEDPLSKGAMAAAIAVALSACGGGVVFRIRKYHIDSK